MREDDERREERLQIGADAPGDDAARNEALEREHRALTKQLAAVEAALAFKYEAPPRPERRPAVDALDKDVVAKALLAAAKALKPDPEHQVLARCMGLVDEGDATSERRPLAALKLVPTPGELELLVEHFVRGIPRRELGRARRSMLEWAEARVAFFAQHVPFDKAAVFKTSRWLRPTELLVLIALWQTALSPAEAARALTVSEREVLAAVGSANARLACAARRHRALAPYAFMLAELAGGRLWAPAQERPGRAIAGARAWVGRRRSRSVFGRR